MDQEVNVEYKTLLVDYILPALTQFAFVEVAYSLRLRFANNTVTLPDSEQGSNASLSDIKIVLDRAEHGNVLPRTFDRKVVSPQRQVP